MSFPDKINDIAAADLDGDGRDEVVIGRQDCKVTVLDSAGKEKWSRALEFYRRPPYVNVVRTGDLDGDGRPEVIVGGENWRFYAFAADGRPLVELRERSSLALGRGGRPRRRRQGRGALRHPLLLDDHPESRRHQALGLRNIRQRVSGRSATISPSARSTATERREWSSAAATARSTISRSTGSCA